MGDEQQPRTRSSSAKPDLKKQIYDLISKDRLFLDLIADAVSTYIVDRITEDDKFVSNVSTKLPSLLDFQNSIAKEILEDVKQQVYEGLSFDIDVAKEKIEEL